MKRSMFSLASAVMLFSGSALANIDALISKDLIIMSAKTGQVLSTDEGPLLNGANVYQNSYTGSDAQLWKINPLENGSFSITHKQTGKVLEVEDGGIVSGDNIRLWDYFPVSHHQWNVDLIGGEVYKLLNKASSFSLDVEGGFDNPGTNIQQWEYLSNPQQHWIIVDASNTYTETQEFSQVYGASIISDANASAGQFIRFDDDSRIYFDVQLRANTSYAYKLTYKSPDGEKKQNLYIDNQLVEEVTFPQTDSWSTISLPINIENDVANHTISLHTGWGYMDIDNLIIEANKLPEAGINEIEAESAIIDGTPLTFNDTDASNGQYVKYNEDGKLSFTFYVQQAGNYNVTMRHSGKGAEGTRYMLVEHGGVEKNVAFNNQLNAWSDTTTSFEFTQGLNTVNIYGGWGYVAFDKVNIALNTGKPALDNLFYPGNLFVVGGLHGVYSFGRCSKGYSTGVSNEFGIFDDRYYIRAGSDTDYCVPGGTDDRGDIYLDLETGNIFEQHSSDGAVTYEATTLPPQAGGDVTEYTNLLNRMTKLIRDFNEPYVETSADLDDVNMIIDYLDDIKITISE